MSILFFLKPHYETTDTEVPTSSGGGGGVIIVRRSARKAKKRIKELAKTYRPPLPDGLSGHTLTDWLANYYKLEKNITKIARERLALFRVKQIQEQEDEEFMLAYIVGLFDE